MFSTKFLYENVFKVSGVPIVFDSHHHDLGPQDLDYHDAFHLARQTWIDRGVKQQCHHSNSKKNYEVESVSKTAHSDWYYEPFKDLGYAYDVPMLEARFVTSEQGTGIVHCAPSHGPDDFNL